MTPVLGQLLTVSDAATYLGVTPFRLRGLIRTDGLVAVRATGGKVLGVYEADCDAWLAAHRRGSKPAARSTVDEQVARLPGAGRF
jgi:excisionase family DNA binding protein